MSSERTTERSCTGTGVSEDSFMAALPVVSGYQTYPYCPNTVKGSRKFIGSFSVADHHCVTEATDNYGYQLYRQGMAASMVHPGQIRHLGRLYAGTHTGTVGNGETAFFPYGKARSGDVAKRMAKCPGKSNAGAFYCLSASYLKSRTQMQKKGK